MSLISTGTISLDSMVPLNLKDSSSNLMNDFDPRMIRTRMLKENLTWILNKWVYIWVTMDLHFSRNLSFAFVGNFSNLRNISQERKKLSTNKSKQTCIMNQ